MIIQSSQALYPLKAFQPLQFVHQCFPFRVKTPQNLKIGKFKFSKSKSVIRNWFQHSKIDSVQLHFTCRIQIWKKNWKKFCSRDLTQLICVLQTLIIKNPQFLRYFQKIYFEWKVLLESITYTKIIIIH